MSHRLDHVDQSAAGGVHVAQATIVLHRGGLALACGRDGQLSADEQHGLFAGDTRVLSTYHLGISGTVWRLLGRSNQSSASCVWMYQNPRFRDTAGEVAAGSLHLMLSRRLEDDALHDEVSVRAYVGRPLSARLSLQLDADFADIFEVHDRSLPPRLKVRHDTSHGDLRMGYARRGFTRGIRVTFTPSAGAPIFAGSYVIFPLELASGAEWRCHIAAVPELGSDGLLPAGASKATENAMWRSIPDLSATMLDADPVLKRTFERGCADLRALAIPQPGHMPYLAAGVPWFLTLFSRDTLMTSLMSGVDGLWSARGALAATGAYQATERDDFRDAEPGKFPHELRRGELASRRAIPQSPMYYGAHDAPALYCMALWNAWRWTGDNSLLDAHLDSAQAALRWCDEAGDRDGDGLLEYGTRSPVGYRNQSWKDAADAIVHADGSQPSLPLATVEMQGYLFAARLAMAELLEAAGEGDTARQTREAAFALRAIVEERYWLADQRYYAMALDGQKRHVTGIASNPGHLLWCGLPTSDRAKLVAMRCLERDLFSGWGLRTLSSENPAYNPLAYQRGSVWPHDTMLLAAGLCRYGCHELAAPFIRAILEAGRAFEDERLPELFCGFERAIGLPVPYEQANSPQAWAAAAPLLAVQILLGLQPDAPHGRCLIAPWLPDWLPRVALRHVEVGQGSFDITVSRHADRTVVDELESRDVEVVVGTAPAPLWGEPVLPTDADRGNPERQDLADEGATPS